VSHYATVWRCKGNVLRKIGTWRNWEFWSKLAAARIWMTHSTKVAWRKDNRLQRKEKDDIAPRTPKGRTSRMKCWKGPVYKIGIKNPDARRQLCLEIERT
jgi:hypothetical protein